MPDIFIDVCLVLQVLNPQRQPLGGTVNVSARQQATGQTVNLTAADASQNIDVDGLLRGPLGSYVVTVTPTDVPVPSSQSVQIPLIGFVTLVFEIDKTAGQPVYTIPDSYAQADLPAALNVRLAGTPANGVAGAAAGATSVIWVNGGNEVLVHLDSIQTTILDGMVVISVDLECDQTGRTPLICAFAVSDGNDLGGLTATTDEYPRGDGRLAATWGQQVQQALWSSVMSLANDHATERGLASRGVTATAGTLNLVAGNPIVVKPA